jgi:Zn-dependent M28 family amino/carboxypeptidase
MRNVSAMPGDQTTSDSQRPLPMVLFALARPGSPLLPSNWPTDDSPQPLTGRRFSGLIDVRHEPFTAYNVVAIVRGTDYRMNKTYVAFGAHYDHIGIQTGLKPDSIANGADDDGSGSVTMLAVAKSLMAARPRRSALFVWHVGEEKGLLGSEYFTDHPTVPIDSIVAQLNADMIGRRGGSTASFDSRVSGASAADRLYIVGPNAAPNNQSKALGAILDSVNARQRPPLRLDHEWDTATHPERIYYRSDHYNYARKGIPIVFFTTGLHEDYHKVSDEPQKIDYDKMARVGDLLTQLGSALANRSTRPR